MTSPPCPGERFARRHGSAFTVILSSAGGARLEVTVASGQGRLLGLIGVPELPPGLGLLIPRCSSVHTLGMRFALDVVWLRWPPNGGDTEVLAVREDLRPRRIAGVRGGRLGADRRKLAALELAAGEARRLLLRPGDLLQAAAL